MAERNLRVYRERLLAERKRFENDRARLGNRAQSLSEEVSELSDFDPNHIGDAGTETFEREKDLLLEHNVEAFLAQVDDALAKIENGTYGLCDMCGKPIADARLEDLPLATLCIDCQSRMEAV